MKTFSSSSLSLGRVLHFISAGCSFFVCLNTVRVSRVRFQRTNNKKKKQAPRHSSLWFYALTISLECFKFPCGLLLSSFLRSTENHKLCIKMLIIFFAYKKKTEFGSHRSIGAGFQEKKFMRIIQIRSRFQTAHTAVDLCQKFTILRRLLRSLKKSSRKSSLFSNFLKGRENSNVKDHD